MGYFWDYAKGKAYDNYTGRYKTATELAFILRNGANHFNRILDVAGGAGRFSIPLLEQSKDITVIDINKEAIELLNERNKNISTICGDFIKTEIDGKFSLIICIEAVSYFQNWEEFFTKISTLLSNDGRFIFTYTNLNSWRFYLRKLNHLGEKYPFHEMNFYNFEKMLGKCNFEVVAMEGMNWIPLPVSSNSILVNFFARVEKLFSLNRWHSQSPWLLISIKKTNQHSEK